MVKVSHLRGERVKSPHCGHDGRKPLYATHTGARKPELEEKARQAVALIRERPGILQNEMCHILGIPNNSVETVLQRIDELAFFFIENVNSKRIRLYVGRDTWEKMTHWENKWHDGN